MSEFIVSEDFAITPAMRDHMQGHIEHLQRELGDDTKISIYLKKVADHNFSAHYQVRFLKKDLITEFNGPDLYKSMDRAFHALVLQIHKLSQKRIDQRRRASSERKAARSA